jgi:hypothetical protein
MRSVFNVTYKFLVKCTVLQKNNVAVDLRKKVFFFFWDHMGW